MMSLYTRAWSKRIWSNSVFNFILHSQHPIELSQTIQFLNKVVHVFTLLERDLEEILL